MRAMGIDNRVINGEQIHLLEKITLNPQRDGKPQRLSIELKDADKVSSIAICY